MSINIKGYYFEGPFQNHSHLNLASGVYIILDKDSNVIDVGESGNVQIRVANHDRKDCWVKHGGSAVAVIYTTDEWERLDTEKVIRDLCNPPCGKR